VVARAVVDEGDAVDVAAAAGDVDRAADLIVEAVA
jgi:hypothetical protein